MPQLVVILTSMPAGDDDSRTDELARTLVDERLAACVNVHGPMTSTCRWKGTVEREAERQILIKTTTAHVGEIEPRFRPTPPYELPEFIVVRPESVSEAYGAWVREET